MARKALKNEKNISYDDEKKKYYVCFDYGKGESGKRKKQSGQETSFRMTILTVRLFNHRK